MNNTQNTANFLNKRVSYSANPVNGFSTAYGVGKKYLARILAREFANPGQRFSDIYNPELEGRVLEFIQSIPDWAKNNQQYSGSANHCLDEDLDRLIKGNILNLKEKRSRRGLRHSWGSKKIRSQNTRHNGRRFKISVVRRKR